MSLNLPTGFLELDEQTTPSTNPPAGRRLIYPKSTGWYELDSGGTESLLGILDHGGLSGLSDDDHPIYPLLLGRSLGQAIYGSPDSGENLDLYGTSHATQGTVRVRDSDLGLDDYNKVAAADRRIRNLSGILSLTNTAQVEGRYLSKDSIEQLSTGDLSDGATILFDADIGSSVQAWDADLDTYAANPLTSGELGELQNINAVTITNAQWGYVGASDQQLAQADSPTFAGLALTGSGSLSDDVQLQFGTSADAVLEWDTAQTVDALMVGVDGTGRALIVGEKADVSTNRGLSAQTNPTLYVWSADAADASDFVSLAHDQTNAIIGVGQGDLYVDGANGIVLDEVASHANPAANTGVLFHKTSDNHVYWRDESGNEFDLTEVGGGSGGGSATFETLNVDSGGLVGNVGSGEDTLKNYNMPAGTMGTDGDRVIITVAGRVEGSGRSINIRVYMGGTSGLKLIDYNESSNSHDFHIRIEVIRTGSSAQKYVSWLNGGTSVTSVVRAENGTRDLTAAQDIVVTGQNNTDTVSDQARVSILNVELHRAP